VRSNLSGHRIEQDIASIRTLSLGKLSISMDGPQVEAHSLVECRNWQYVIPNICLSLVCFKSKPIERGSRYHFSFPKSSALEIRLAGFHNGHALLDPLSRDSRKNSLKIRSVEAILAHQSLNPVQQTLFCVLDPVIRPWRRRKLRVENRDQSPHRPA
jgi:hypothetical protein